MQHPQQYMTCPWSRTCSHKLSINCKKCILYHSWLTLSDFVIPAKKEHANSVDFCIFCCKLFHTLILLILESLCSGETTPEVCLCPNKLYQCIIWGIGPYIYINCLPQTCSINSSRGPSKII